MSPKTLVALFLYTAAHAVCVTNLAAQEDSLILLEGPLVGIGTSTPQHRLHIEGNDGETKLLVRETQGDSFEALMELHNEDGDVGFRLRNPSGLADFNKIGSEFRINIDSTPPELQLLANGDLIIRGTLTAGAPPQTFPDYVFAPNYQLMPLNDLGTFVRDHQHLPRIPSGDEIAEREQINMSDLQMRLLEKIEELTLYILQLHQRTETLEKHTEAASSARCTTPELLWAKD